MSWNHTCPRCHKQSPAGKLFCGVTCTEIFAKGGFCRTCKKKGTIFDPESCSVIDYCEDHKDEAIKDLSVSKVYGIHNARRLSRTLAEVEREVSDLKKSKKRYQKEAEDSKDDSQMYKKLWKEEKEKRSKLEEVMQESKKSEDTNNLINMLYTIKTLNGINPNKY